MLEIGEIISIMGIDRWKVEEELPPGIGIVDFYLKLARPNQGNKQSN